MGLHEEHHSNSYPEFQDEDFYEEEDLNHKKKIRRLLEERLERKRLKDECRDELYGDDEFDWSELDK